MHEPRLSAALRTLLHGQRVGALGTLGPDGRPQVSMVPFAIDRALGCLVLHVSALAAHTRNLQSAPEVSLMVMQPEVAGEPVHALPRVSLEATAELIAPEGPRWLSLRAAYLARFPEAEPMTQLGDFRFVALQPVAARHVAGFGAARGVDGEELARVLAAAD
ncbi:MAG: pyridoxamine 5'-phosphate oxidase family protein [Rhodoferax sp.]